MTAMVDQIVSPCEEIRHIDRTPVLNLVDGEEAEANITCDRMHT
jgi:hypothetical protein